MRLDNRTNGLALALASACLAVAQAGDLKLTPWKLPGGQATLPLGGETLENPAARFNVSGVTHLEAEGRGYLGVAVDEGTQFVLVPLEGEGAGRVPEVVDLVDLLRESGDDALGKADEIDLEGASFEGDRLYLAGSATVKRKKPDKGDREANLKRLQTVIPVSGGKPPRWKTHSNFVYEIRVKQAGGRPALRVEARHDIRERLARDALLRRSLAIPSKENGLDLEGYCHHEGRHYLALRGPVLRGHAVVAVLDEDFHSMELRFLALGGLGIRSLEYLEHPTWGAGFFLVAGLTMEGTAPFALYRWDGRSDSFMEPGPGLELLGGLVPPDPGWKAEALFACGDDLCVAFDGPEGGAPHRVRP